MNFSEPFELQALEGFLQRGKWEYHWPDWPELLEEPEPIPVVEPRFLRPVPPEVAERKPAERAGTEVPPKEEATQSIQREGAAAAAAGDAATETGAAGGAEPAAMDTAQKPVQISRESVQRIGQPASLLHHALAPRLQITVFLPNRSPMEFYVRSRKYGLCQSNQCMGIGISNELFDVFVS